ncbi:RNA polymerase subunit sigma24 [Pontibacter sp. HJ8]
MILSEKSRATDAEVVARVLEGEKELYELLMRRYNQTLYRTVRSYLKEEQDTEDAMQDTYLAAYEKLYQFRHDARFSTWLIRIGINVALGKLRERKKFAPAPEPTETPHDNYPYLLTQSNFMNPENMAIRKEVKQLLEQAIDRMPEKYRVIYTLLEVEGMSSHEVTQCLDISESNAKVRLHRAKSMLKDSLYKLSISQDVFEYGYKRCDAMVERVMAALP